MLSHKTIIKIYPEFENYIEKKSIKGDKQNEANYENAYFVYYMNPQQMKQSQVNRILIRRQKDNMIMKTLIEQRKKEDFQRFNKDKINSSLFTGKIDVINATFESSLESLKNKIANGSKHR